MTDFPLNFSGSRISLFFLYGVKNCFLCYLVILTLLFQHIPGNFQTKDIFSQFSQASQFHFLISFYYFITSLFHCFQSWCSQMVLFSLLFLRCPDIFLPRIINLLSTFEKDIPPLSLTNLFFITHCLCPCFCILLLCSFLIMEH